MSDAAARFGDGASIRTSYRYLELDACHPYYSKGPPAGEMDEKDVYWRPGSFPRASNNMW